MDNVLLEQLMKKPIAKKQEKVKIKLPGKGEIAIKTKIVERKKIKCNDFIFNLSLCSSIT